MPEIANVTLYKTYDEWRFITNQQVVIMNDLLSNGNLMRFQSNSVALSITSNIAANGKVYVSMNTTNSISNTSNVLFATSNAFNTVHGFYRTVFNQVNAAYTEVNARATEANVAITYNQANLVFAELDVPYANLYINSAHQFANWAWLYTNNYATDANVRIIYSLANAARNTCNSADFHATAAASPTAFAWANQSMDAANTAFNQGNNGYVMANIALPKVIKRQTIIDGPRAGNGWFSDSYTDGYGYGGWALFMGWYTDPAAQVTLSGGVPMVNVTASRPLIVTVADGFDQYGDKDYVYAITSNVRFYGLTGNANNFLYINAISGANGSTTKEPLYYYYGAPNTTLNQFSFIISEMKGYMGTGSGADPAPIIFVGMVEANTTHVTRSWPTAAYNSTHSGPWVAANTNVGNQGTPAYAQFRHSLLQREYLQANWFYRCIGAELGYSVGDVVVNLDSRYWHRIMPWHNELQQGIAILQTSSPYKVVLNNKGAASETQITDTKWVFKHTVERIW